MDCRTMRPLKLLFTPKSKCFLCFRYRLANFITGGELIANHEEIKLQIAYLRAKAKEGNFHISEIDYAINRLQNGAKTVYR